MGSVAIPYPSDKKKKIRSTSHNGGSGWGSGDLCARDARHFCVPLP